ncbi:MULTISPECIES: VirB3 family type IV secretion system protein [Prosthecochloris]|uniref:Conjugal transfer protein n=1 Tax=Prosthecochloris vibrioformis TaxID=1098 RepID=A0A5C4S3F7_PROVB|nr:MULTISPECIES: VirB3 family type IV secretion system protein [Prosthecochloris]ANT65596.1 Type IV secretory pathway, VirB3-like protein [Prosthecochloris sp. CIB 2401]TNJ38023.1 conjugal transfer protein [Prosthecochloris vibrioformis]
MIEGYEVPLHKALTEVILLAGVPRTLAFLLWTTASAIGFGLHQIWVVPVAAVAHIIFSLLAKRDPFFFEVFIRALKTPKQLDP